jgi:hypothetical protein
LLSQLRNVQAKEPAQPTVVRQQPLRDGGVGFTPTNCRCRKQEGSVVLRFTADDADVLAAA